MNFTSVCGKIRMIVHLSKIVKYMGELYEEQKYFFGNNFDLYRSRGVLTTVSVNEYKNIARSDTL